MKNEQYMQRVTIGHDASIAVTGTGMLLFGRRRTKVKSKRRREKEKRYATGATANYLVKLIHIAGSHTTSFTVGMTALSGGVPMNDDAWGHFGDQPIRCGGGRQAQRGGGRTL